VESDDARHGDRHRRQAGRDADGGGDMTAPRHARYGEELGMAAVPLGDDVKKDGENIWISRMLIDLA